MCVHTKTVWHQPTTYSPTLILSYLYVLIIPTTRKQGDMAHNPERRIGTKPRAPCAVTFSCPWGQCIQGDISQGQVSAGRSLPWGPGWCSCSAGGRSNITQFGEVSSSPGNPACPGTSQSCAVKHLACPSDSPKLFLSVGSKLKQAQRVFYPRELHCVLVWLTMALGIGTVWTGGCGMWAQDRRYFPAYKPNTLPPGSLRY